MVKAYCLRQKKEVEVKNPKYELNKIGRPIVRGECSDCGGKVQKLLKTEEIPSELKAKMGKYERSSSRRTSRRSRKSSRKSRKSSRL